MGLRSKLSSLLERPWYRTDEWVEVTSSRAHVITEENGASWDVEVRWVHKYRHKDTAEIRYRAGTYVDLGETHTTFEDPRDRKMEWSCLFGRVTSEPFDESELYSGK